MNTSNQLGTAAQLCTGSSEPLPRTRDGCWSNLSSPPSPCIITLMSVNLPICGYVWQVLGCLIFLQCSVNSSHSLLRSQDATPVQQDQDLSLLSMCFNQAVVKHLLTISCINSFFLSAQQIFLQAKHEELYSAQSLKCTLNFQGGCFKEGSILAGILNKRKKRKKIMQWGRIEAWLFWCLFLFYASKDSIVWRICLQSNSLPSLPPFLPSFFSLHPSLSCSSSLFSW